MNYQTEELQLSIIVIQEIISTTLKTDLSSNYKRITDTERKN